MNTTGLFRRNELKGPSGVVEVEEEKMSFHLESLLDEADKSIEVDFSLLVDVEVEMKLLLPITQEDPDYDVR